jgi:uncharacterized protein (UPF0297 family)
MKATLIIYKEEIMQIDETMCFNVLKDEKKDNTEILKKVYDALKEKGYNPINQIVGYILSGDPTYITSYNGARNLIRQIERDDLLEEMVKKYIGVK